MQNDPVNFVDPSGLTRMECVTYTIEETGASYTVCFDAENPHDAVQVRDPYGAISRERLLQFIIEQAGNDYSRDTIRDRIGGSWRFTPSMSGVGKYSNPCTDPQYQEIVNRQLNQAASVLGRGANVSTWSPGQGKVDNFDRQASLGTLVGRLEAIGFQQFYSFNSQHPGVNLQKATTNGRVIHVTLSNDGTINRIIGKTGDSATFSSPNYSSPASGISIHCDNGTNYSMRHILKDYIGIDIP